MGKRSDFERLSKDFYTTPPEAVAPLLAHLKDDSTFIEPCAGDGRLIRELSSHGHQCVQAIDIDPQSEGIVVQDAFTANFVKADYIITNPPWSRPILHKLIPCFYQHLPTWLLFDADWMHTRQSAELIKHCHKIISVGRVKWIEESRFVGKDNCCWYLFNEAPGDTIFVGRTSLSTAELTLEDLGL